MWKLRTTALQPISETPLKDSGERTYFRWEEIWAMHLLVHFTWKGNWPSMWLCTNSWALANGLADSQGSHGKWLEKLWQTNLWKRCVGRPLWMGKNVQIFMSHVYAYQRVTSVEENVYNQADRWPILWIPVSVFPQPPLLSLNGLMNKVAMVAEMELITYGLSHMDFHSPRLTWLWPPPSAQSAISRNQLWTPNMASFPRMFS